MLFEPGREALVQFRPRSLRQRFVGRVADQEVAEAVCILARELRLVRPDELLADETVQAGLHLRFLGGEGLHGATVEDTPLDGASLQHSAFSWLELVDPRGEQGLNRSRHSDLAVARVLDERDHLLDEERIPLRRVADPLLEIRRERGVTEQPLQQLVGLGGAERLEQERRRVQLAAAPALPLVEELRPRDAEEQDRRLAREIGNVLEEVEEGRLAPVDVVEHRDDGRRLGRTLDQLPHCPGDLVARSDVVVLAQQPLDRRDGLGLQAELGR